jgi:hypothetical protein
MAEALYKEVQQVLLTQQQNILRLSIQQYTEKQSILSQSSIGEHTRHIIELFQCLLHGYKTGLVNYDNRERNIRIQSDINYAVNCMVEIMQGCELPNKNLNLLATLENAEMPITTNYYRELYYNLEHCIHHQAIIKIGLLCLGMHDIENNFGVAPSTVKYQTACAQ